MGNNDPRQDGVGDEFVPRLIEESPPSAEAPLADEPGVVPSSATVVNMALILDPEASDQGGPSADALERAKILKDKGYDPLAVFAANGRQRGLREESGEKPTVVALRVPTPIPLAQASRSPVLLAALGPVVVVLFIFFVAWVVRNH